MSESFLTIDTSDLQMMARLLPKMGEMIFSEANRAMQKSVSYLRTTAVSIAHKKEVTGATGHYIQGLQKDVTGATLDNLTGRLAATAGHSWYVENGRAPGRMPPYDAIALWVKRKGIAQAGKFKRGDAAFKQSVKSFRKQVAAQAAFDSTVFAIRLAIARRGTIRRFMHGSVGPAGARVMAETYEQCKPQIAVYFREATERARDKIVSEGIAGARKAAGV